MDEKKSHFCIQQSPQRAPYDRPTAAAPRHDACRSQAPIMKRKLLFGLLWSLASYFVGVVAGVLLMPVLTSNRHDASVEVVMTSVFVFGPLLAVIGFIVGAIVTRRSQMIVSN